MATNTADKATGFASSLDKGKSAIEALLTLEDESQQVEEAKTEEVVTESEETDEVNEDEDIDLEEVIAALSEEEDEEKATN